MRITAGTIDIRIHASPHYDVFEIRVGNAAKMLSNSVALESQSRRYDHLMVARALRDMAHELEAQDG